MNYYELKPGAAGMPAKLTFEVHNSSQNNVTVRMGFYDAQGSPPIEVSSTSYLILSGMGFLIENEKISIPIGAKYIGPVLDGVATVYMYNLEINELPFVERSIDGTNYIMQNGYLAFATLQPNFYTHDLPSRNVEINGASAIVQGVQKKKKQEVKFPMLKDPDLNQLIKTKIGNGAIEKLGLTLHSRSAKITLKYDTE